MIATAARPDPDSGPREAEPLLDVRGLTVSLDRDGERIDLVRGVSFTVMPGEILGLVGESGAGKSMIGTAVIGLLDEPIAITGGEIRYRGRRIDDLPPAGLRALRGRHIATIFQDPLTALNPVFSVERQLVETIEAHTPLRGTAAREEAVGLLARVGIPAPEKRLSSYPHEFSGGMRQRVVIALALAGRPDVIIADEPTTALDVSVQGQIIELLRDLCAERGMAVILVTHDMGVIATLAHRVAVAYAGRIVELGPVAEVVRHPRHPYTRGLMAAIPAIGARPRRLTQIPGAMPRPDAVPPGCAFSPRCPLAEPRCGEGLPPEWVQGGHRAACWRANEAANAP